jgi:hypothetical protein
LALDFWNLFGGVSSFSDSLDFLLNILNYHCLVVITNNEVIKGVHFVEHGFIAIQLELEEQVFVSYRICK